MLKPIQFPGKEEPVYGTDSPIVACECCGESGPSHLMMNAICVIGSPGHPSMEAFQCPSVEHWACSFDCWSKVMVACIEEHMRPLLEAKHKQRELEQRQLEKEENDA